MEFEFDINKYFKNEITKIGSRLIPEGLIVDGHKFTGDGHEFNGDGHEFIGDGNEFEECVTRMSLVLTVLGENSAKAQGLEKLITSGEQLKHTEHIVYVLADPKGGSKGTGCVLGMLKMGNKHLYVVDAGGNNHEITARCVLDFYIHETKQRMGFGRKLFQHMLDEENIGAQHLAIDKPSSDILSFLRKHYNLETIIPQSYNFVVFDGFFTDRLSQITDSRIHAAGLHSFTPRYSSGTLASFSPPMPGTQATHSQPQPQPEITAATHAENMDNQPHYGRHAAFKAVSTMEGIMQHETSRHTPPQPNRYGNVELDDTTTEEVKQQQ